MIISPKGMVMIDRRTGKHVGPVIPLKPRDSFYRLPRLDQRVWRYMDHWKFENLIKDKALYFRRSDRLEDDMEGKYAEANRTYTTAVWQRFTEAYSIKHDAESREQGALGFRYHIFLSCWHINETENPDMWRLYTKGPESVAIVSTVRKLLAAMEKHQVVPGRVRYAPQSTPRPEWSYYAPFFFKDTRFMGEREFRLIGSPPDDQPVRIDTMIGLNLSAAPEAIIDLVKLHPSSPAAFKDQVKSFLASHSTKLAVSKSCLPPLSPKPAP
ncbi:MAG: hypothetical protein ACYDH9_02025 [Limisphaerales bacterium]